jgi:hypothetical protein
MRQSGRFAATLDAIGFSVGATDARKTSATGLRLLADFAFNIRLQCRKTLPVQQYCQP